MLGLAVLAVLVAVGAASAADDMRPLGANGIVVRAPSEWSRIDAADDHQLNPRTLLVIATRGAAARESECQVAAYRIPAAGAAVVILGWRGAAADGVPRDRSELAAMRLRRPIFACWPGRGSVAQIALKGRAYQVNVLVGDKASTQTISDAMSVARSIALGS
jgi:hypothetical protein